MPRYVNEASGFTLRARFFDTANDATTPESVRYSNRDLSNDRTVRDWTSVTPGAEIDIEVIASDNLCFTNNRRPKRSERRVITVQANAGLPSQRTAEIEYWIRNLAGIVN